MFLDGNKDLQVALFIVTGVSWKAFKTSKLSSITNLHTNGATVKSRYEMKVKLILRVREKVAPKRQNNFFRVLFFGLKQREHDHVLGTFNFDNYL